MKLLSRWFRRSDGAPSWIEATALATRLEQNGALLVLDVRGPDEFTGPLGHIEGAINLPLGELPDRASDLVRDDRPVVVVCKTDRIAPHPGPLPASGAREKTAQRPSPRFSGEREGREGEGQQATDLGRFAAQYR